MDYSATRNRLLELRKAFTHLPTLPSFVAGYFALHTTPAEHIAIHNKLMLDDDVYAHQMNDPFADSQPKGLSVHTTQKPKGLSVHTTQPSSTPTSTPSLTPSVVHASNPSSTSTTIINTSQPNTQQNKTANRSSATQGQLASGSMVTTTVPSGHIKINTQHLQVIQPVTTLPTTQLTINTDHDHIINHQDVNGK
jgi:hypothetical protein